MFWGMFTDYSFNQFWEFNASSGNVAISENIFGFFVCAHFQIQDVFV